MGLLIWPGVVLIGGAGSVLRFMVDGLVSARAGRRFPVGTLVINVSGALILGLLAGLALSPAAALLAGTAAVGSYTTFFDLDVRDRAAGRGPRAPAALAANVVVSLVLGVAAAALGQLIGQHL